MRRGGDYVRSRLRLFPSEEVFAFAMEIEERIYRWTKVHGPVDEGTAAAALDALRAAFGTVVVASAPGHPLARELAEAASDPKGPFAKFKERQPGARAKVVARLAEDVRARAGVSPGYLDLLGPFFDQVSEPRSLAAEIRAKGGERVSPGGIVLP